MGLCGVGVTLADKLGVEVGVGVGLPGIEAVGVIVRVGVNDCVGVIVGVNVFVGVIEGVGVGVIKIVIPSIQDCESSILITKSVSAVGDGTVNVNGNTATEAT